MARYCTYLPIVGLLALAACVLPGDKRVEETGLIRPPPLEAGGNIEAPRVQVDPPPPSRPARLAGRRPLPPKPLPRPRFPRVRESQLAGLSAEDALSLFGKPAHAEHDGRTVVWSYRRDGCRLSLVFQFSVADNALRTVEYDLATGPTPEAICLHVLGAEATRIATRPQPASLERGRIELNRLER